MKKLFFSLALALCVMAVSCQKEDMITPIDYNPQIPDVDLSVDLTGVWTPTANTTFRVYFYTMDDNTLIDSLVSDMGEVGFTFNADKSVATPWQVPATYTVDSTRIIFDLMGLFTRTYDLKYMQPNHLAFEMVDTSMYTMPNENGEDVPVKGVEFEYWDLERK